MCVNVPPKVAHAWYKLLYFIINLCFKGLTCVAPAWFLDGNGNIHINLFCMLLLQLQVKERHMLVSQDQILVWLTPESSLKCMLSFWYMTCVYTVVVK